MMVCEALSRDYTTTYQISLTYIQKGKKVSYLPDTKTLKKYQLFDREVKVQGKTEVKMAHDTPSHDYTPTCQISLTYWKRQKSYGPTYSKFANPFRFNNELTPFFVYFLV